MKVSIVTPAYNEEDCIEKCIKAILKQKHKNLEMILVDDGSTDRTLEIAKKYPIKIVKGKHKGNSIAKNLGWSKATGDIVMFIDADMLIHSNYVKETVKCFDDPEVGGVAHKEMKSNKKLSFVSRMLNLRKALGEVTIPMCVKACYRKFYKTLGGFDPSYGYYDDWELGVKIKDAGYKVVWTNSKIKHEEIQKFSRLARQCRWMGRSITFKKYKLDATKKLFYTLLSAFLPIYIILFLAFFYPTSSLGFILWIMGLIGLISFFSLELYRSFRIFFYSKDPASFLTPIFDYITMTFVFMGFVDKLFGKGVKI